MKLRIGMYIGNVANQTLLCNGYHWLKYKSMRLPFILFLYIELFDGKREMNKKKQRMTLVVVAGFKKILLGQFIRLLNSYPEQWEKRKFLSILKYLCLIYHSIILVLFVFLSFFFCSHAYFNQNVSSGNNIKKVSSKNYSSMIYDTN